jgi:hypothetical protein
MSEIEDLDLKIYFVVLKLDNEVEGKLRLMRRAEGNE